MAVSRQHSWDGAVPAPLRPLLRAYLLGYGSTVAPELVTVLLKWSAARKRKTARDGPQKADTTSLAALGASTQRVLCGGLAWRRFPAFCAALVGGSTLLAPPLRLLLAQWLPRLSSRARTRLAHCLAAFMAAYASIQLLQARQQKRQPVEGEGQENAPTKQPAGKTLDLTLFAATRAADVLIGGMWAQWRAHRTRAGRWTRGEAAVGAGTDACLFAVSSALVMWTWIYTPWRLPRAYDRWIAAAAAVDDRLPEALRRCRGGELRYGDPDGPVRGRLLMDMCRDYGWPTAWGDPAVAVPFPCDIVHMGAGPSCERHALVRFGRAWRWALATQLPLTLVALLARARRPLPPHTTAAVALARRLVRGVASAARSSAFLAAFVSLFFYGVCLTRTRLGPRLLGVSAAVRLRIDSGLCVAGGCALCGASILLERPARRKDVALFVAPRALATLLPRHYDARLQWRENVLFAASAAVVLAAVQDDPRRVRGLLGSVLRAVVVPRPRAMA